MFRAIQLHYVLLLAREQIYLDLLATKRLKLMITYRVPESWSRQLSAPYSTILQTLINI